MVQIACAEPGCASNFELVGSGGDMGFYIIYLPLGWTAKIDGLTDGSSRIIFCCPRCDQEGS